MEQLKFCLNCKKNKNIKYFPPYRSRCSKCIKKLTVHFD